MSDGIHIDVSSFIDWIDGLETEILDAVEEGLGMAGEALLNHTLVEMPRTPVDEGTLRGSGSVFVNNKLKATSPDSGGRPTPATEDDTTLPPDVMVAVVGFNTPYAAYQHEGIRQDGTHKVSEYSHPGVGAKFLEKKALENAKEYQAIIANQVRKVTG